MGFGLYLEGTVLLAARFRRFRPGPDDFLGWTVLSGDRRMSKRTGKNYLFCGQVQPRWHEHLDVQLLDFKVVRFKRTQKLRVRTPGRRPGPQSLKVIWTNPSVESHCHHCYRHYHHQPWGNGPEDESGASARLSWVVSHPSGCEICVKPWSKSWYWWSCDAPVAHIELCFDRFWGPFTLTMPSRDALLHWSMLCKQFFVAFHDARAAACKALLHDFTWSCQQKNLEAHKTRHDRQNQRTHIRLQTTPAISVTAIKLRHQAGQWQEIPRGDFCSGHSLMHFSSLYASARRPKRRCVKCHQWDCSALVVEALNVPCCSTLSWKICGTSRVLGLPGPKGIAKLGKGVHFSSSQICQWSRGNEVQWSIKRSGKGEMEVFFHLDHQLFSEWLLGGGFKHF